MTDKAQPFTKEEREEEIALAMAAEGCSPMSREGERRSRILDYEATVAVVEGRRDELVACANALIDEVASLRKERDAAMAVAELFIDGDDPKKMARSYRAHAVYFSGQGKEDRAARCVARAEALEDLP